MLVVLTAHILCNYLSHKNLHNKIVMEGTAKMRAELTHSLSDINDPNRPTKKLGWFDWIDMDIGKL